MRIVPTDSWYLKYIRELPRKHLFFSDYGVFMHSLLERYYTGANSSEELCIKYLQDFRKQVVGQAPSEKVFESYFRGGLQCFQDFRPLPYDKVAVEQKVDFRLGNIPFTARLDYIGKKDGQLVIADHKSKRMKPRSGRAKPTKTDEELDDYLVQLYLYALAVEQMYGRLPMTLSFDCFRVPVLIEEPFQKEACDKSVHWLQERISAIENETEFRPNVDAFKCTYLCDLHDFCEYYAFL